MMERLEAMLLEWPVVLLIVGVLTVFIWSKITSYNEKLENRNKIARKREEVKTQKAALEEL